MRRPQTSSQRTSQCHHDLRVTMQSHESEGSARPRANERSTKAGLVKHTEDLLRGGHGVRTVSSEIGRRYTFAKFEDSEAAHRRPVRALQSTGRHRGKPRANY